MGYANYRNRWIVALPAALHTVRMLQQYDELEVFRMTEQANQNKCSHCGRSFNSSSELREHEKNCKTSGSGSSSQERK